MCGILGASSKIIGEGFDAALESIKHRGPDDYATFECQRITLGFVRLAILEIKSGKQPFYLADEKNVIAFNGEIYNYKELRNSLTESGVRFQGTSEAEVLLRGYRFWGDGLALRLRGMFAIAIWDIQFSTLVLMRDPLGKKPLYFYHEADHFAFASEIKALWHLIPFSAQELNVSAVASFLISDSVPTPQSIDRRIKKVKPGTIVKISGKSNSEVQFWPNPKVSQPKKHLDAFVVFQNALSASVERRLMAEVPIGIFLSSGLDSRAVASTVARVSTKRIHSFTLKFDGSYDESVEAEKIAAEYNFEYTPVSSTDEDLAEIWFTAKELIDEPLNDPAVLPMMLLNRAAKEHVKVAITGDGGDELFLGYPNLKLHKYARLFGLPFSSAFKQLLGFWPDDGSYFGFGFQLQRLARGIGISNLPGRDLAWRGGFRWYEIERVLHAGLLNHGEVKNLVEDLTQEFLKSPLGNSIQSRLSWWYLRTYLMDTVLVKVDRASMVFGVECRSPLLDVDLVELVFGLRQNGELKKFPGKKLLAKTVQNNGYALPKVGKKHGMGVPVMRLLKTVLREEFENLTNQDAIQSQGIFSVQYVEELKRNVMVGRREVRKEAWALLVFQAWMQKNANKVGINNELW
jgi:asparagine synthase (glutamine-hydrolysing)